MRWLSMLKFGNFQILGCLIIVILFSCFGFSQDKVKALEEDRGRIMELLSFERSVNERKVRVGGKIVCNVIIRNQTSQKLEIGHSVFQVTLENLALVKPVKPKKGQLKKIVIPAGYHKKVRFVYRALKAGVVKLPTHGHFWDNIKEYRIRFQDSNPNVPSPQINIVPVRLPGIPYPVRNLTKQVKHYFSCFPFRILGISALIILGFWALRSSLKSNNIWSVRWRIGVTHLMVIVVTLIIPFLINGFRWIFSTTLPPTSELLFVVVILLASRYFFKGAVIVRAFFVDLVITGLSILVLSYILHLGIMTFVYYGFSDYPLMEVLIGGFFLGLAVNALLLRKEL